MAAASAYDVEFRAMNDDAWYSVRTLLQGNSLVVKFLNFGDDDDVVFVPRDILSLSHLLAFSRRFRPLSVQLQDSQCRTVRPGSVVCASHSVHSDVKFFDAVLDEVIPGEHCFANGEQECTCTFLIVWQHGPIKGCISQKRVEDICLPQFDSPLDSSVAHFIDIVREHLGDGAVRTPISLGDASMHNDGVPHQEFGCSSTRLNSTFAQQSAQKSRFSPRSPSTMQQDEEMIGNRSPKDREDVDMGGDNNCFVLIDNLDKDLFPSTVVEFIRRQISISIQALIFPSSPWEAYTKGAIMLSSEKDLKELWAFFHSPDHIVISQKGRPCVVTEILSRHDVIAEETRMLMLKYQDKPLRTSFVQIHNDLKLVRSGSEEYRTAKQLRDIFVEFTEHQQRLHKRLTTEERKILH